MLKETCLGTLVLLAFGWWQAIFHALFGTLFPTDSHGTEFEEIHNYKHT